MFSKDVKFGDKAKKSLLRGINLLGDAVGCTLGPKGNCVIIGDIDKKPIITKDGVTVAKYIETKDLTENAGVQLIREAAETMLGLVGDNTTTSVVMAQAMINKAADLIIKNKIHPIKLKQEIQKSASDLLDEFKKYIIPIKDDDILNIATISANNDYSIGALINNAFKQIGKDGIINVDQSQNVDTTVKIIDGMQFDKGYVAPHFVTDRIKDVCNLDNPYILITDQKINRMKDISFILNNIIAENRSILIIAEDYDDEVIETFKLNVLEKRIKGCLVKAPSFGEYRKSILDDIAILTEGYNISYDSGLKLTDTKLNYLGTCNKIIITKENTTIIGGKGNVNDRIQEIKSELDKIKNTSELNGSFKIKFLEERIAKLSSGICTIFVGGTTELELHERKDRVDDAVCATKAAVEEGVIPGGGLVFYNMYKNINNINTISPYTQSVLKAGLIAPFNKIIENAGLIPNKLYKNLTNNIGYDANINEFVDMYAEGIIDPAKCARLALENALSTTCLFLSTYCTIVPEIIIN